MRLHVAFAFVALCACSSISSAQATSAASPLHRHYKEGEKLAYHMKAVNEAWHYEIDANALVKKDAAGRLFEEYQWTHMTSSGQPVAGRVRIGLPAEVVARSRTNPVCAGAGEC